MKSKSKRDGAGFRWVTADNPTGTSTTIWNPFKSDTGYFSPGRADFTINYRVDDLVVLLAQLRAGGCAVDDKTRVSEYGKVGWGSPLSARGSNICGCPRFTRQGGGHHLWRCSLPPCV